MHKEQNYPLQGMKSFFTCLALFTLIICSSLSYAQQLVFKSGFEGNVTGVPAISPRYLTGSDNLTSIPNDWIRDLDFNPRFGQHGFQYEGTDNSRRYAQITQDPQDSANNVLEYWVNAAGDADDNSIRARLQCNIYDNADVREITQKVRMYFDSDFNLVKSYPETFNWLMLFEYWNNANFSGQAFPFRVSVNLQKLTDAPADEIYFCVFGQWEQNGSLTSIWKETATAFPVPTEEWLTAEIYLKEGGADDGRFTFSITRENGEKIQLFDITNYTRHPNDINPNGYQHFNPIKLYTFKNLIDHVRNNGGALQMFWDDFELWEGDARTPNTQDVSRGTTDSLTEYVFPVLEDSYINNANSEKDINYNSTNRIYARNKSSWGFEGYVKFPVQNFGIINKATVKLYGKNPNNTKPVKVGLYATTNDWSETSLTFNNAPPKIGELLDEVEIGGTASFFEWDVTEYLRDQSDLGQEISFVIVSTNSDIERAEFDTKEDGATAPLLVVEGTDESPEKQFILTPIEDSYTNNDPGNAETNYGNSNIMFARNKPTWGYEGFLKFPLVNFKRISQAKLRVYGSNPNNNDTVDIALYKTSNDWNEETLTFNNAPSKEGGIISQVGVDGIPTYHEWDLTAYLQQVDLGTAISFILASIEDNYERARFSTTESGPFFPQLIIDAVEGAFDPLEQTINFPEIENRLTTDGAFELNATASSGLPISYQVISGPATIIDNQVVPNGGTGVVKVVANQEGNEFFLPAFTVVREFILQEPNNVQMFINTIADAEVKNGSSFINENYGTNTSLQARNKTSFGYEFFLKFDLSEIDALNTVKIRIFGENPNNDAPVEVGVYSTADTWTETGITYANKPALISQLATFTVTGIQKYYEIDVTSFIAQEKAGDGIASFGFKSLNNDLERARFKSRETRFNIPELQVEGTPNLNLFLTADDFESSEDFVQMNTYPNPFQNEFTISFPDKNSDWVQIHILDVTGRVIHEQLANDSQVKIKPHGSLPTGLYLLSVSKDGAIVNRKTILKK